MAVAEDVGGGRPQNQVRVTATGHVQARRRFDEHRAAFARNPALRDLYAGWYARIGAYLPELGVGPRLELGSGPGLAAAYLPDMLRSDVVRAPWHHMVAAAEALPFREGTLGALVLFDVLHHLPSPAHFFEEATRVLAPGGRVIVCDPYVSPLSYPVYAWLHEEGLDFAPDALEPRWADGKDPFAGNQALATKLFFREWPRFAARFPSFSLVARRRLAGLSYPAAGGFGRAPLLPLALWKGLLRLEARCPEAAFRWMGFRTLVALERRP